MSCKNAPEISIKEGDTFILNLEWLNADGTPVVDIGYSALFVIRQTPDSPSYISVSSASGEVVISDGNIYIEIPAATMVNLPVVGVAELQVTDPSGTVRTIYSARMRKCWDYAS